MEAVVDCYKMALKEPCPSEFTCVSSHPTLDLYQQNDLPEPLRGNRSNFLGLQAQILRDLELLLSL